MNFLNWIMPSYDVKNPGVKEPDKREDWEIRPKLTYYFVKGKPLSYLEVDQNTRYFSVRMEILESKVDQILEILENRDE